MLGISAACAAPPADYKRNLNIRSAVLSSWFLWRTKNLLTLSRVGEYNIVVSEECRSGGMADAHGSGPCVRKDVEVQLLSAAPKVNVINKSQQAFYLFDGFLCFYRFMLYALCSSTHCSYFLCQKRHYLQAVPHYTIIGYLKNRSIRIFVNCYDGF